MKWFFKRCNHEYELISNQDLYEDNLINNAAECINNMYTTTEIKYTFSEDFIELLKNKNISVDDVIKALENSRETEKDKQIKQLKKQLKDNNRKVIGHYTCQRCKKCGAIVEHTKYFDPIRDRLEHSNSFGWF